MITDAKRPNLEQRRRDNVASWAPLADREGKMLVSPVFTVEGPDWDKWQNGNEVMYIRSEDKTISKIVRITSVTSVVYCRYL